MFGKKKEEAEISKVPVFTVDTLPRKYELLQTVYAEATKPLRNNHEIILDELGRAGFEAGADAVIAPIFHFLGTVSETGAIRAYGTAIRYID